MNFTVSADNKVKMNECEKINKYLDLTRELKKTMENKDDVIPIVVGAYRTSR